MEQLLLKGRYKVLDEKTTKSKQGTFGWVAKALDTKEDRIVAIKEMKESVGTEGLESSVLRERSTLKALKNNYIIELLDDFVIDDRIYLVFPYMEMNLREFIANKYNYKVPPNVTKEIMRQILSALRASHTARFMHRDVKPENIMVETSEKNPEEFVLKLVDWGSSRKMDIYSNQNFTVEVVPLGYRPPELLFGLKKYSETVDIWSVGCIFAQLLFGERLIQEPNANHILYFLVENIGLKQPEDLNWLIKRYQAIGLDETVDELKSFADVTLDSYFKQKTGKVTIGCDLLKKMLRFNPDKRISALDALKHPYFDFNS